MGVEVVTDENDLFGGWILLIEQVFYLVGPVGHGALFMGANSAFPGFWLVKHKNAGGAVSFILMVIAFWLSRFQGKRRAYLLGQLNGLFIHTYHGKISLIGSVIDLQHVFHSGYEIAVLLWGNDPTFS